MNWARRVLLVWCTGKSYRDCKLSRWTYSEIVCIRLESYPIQNITPKNTRYNVTNTAPCHLWRVCLFHTNKKLNKNIWTRRLMIISRLFALLNATGLINAVTQRTKNTLNIFDQTIFHTAILVFDFVIATSDVASSGNDVPTARIVNQISFSLHHRIVARVIALLTTIFPHRANPAIPPITMIVDFRVGRRLMPSSLSSHIGRDLTISTV